jgi:3'-5' exoribonuclease
MKDFYIAEAARFENQVITSSFVVVSKQAKPKKSGELYLAVTLADRTGHMEAKMWDNVADHIDCFEQDDFIKVRGLINKFNGRFQITLHKVRSLEDSEVIFDDYLPRTTKDVAELWRTLGEFVAGMSDPHLKSLLRAFLEDPQIEHAYKNAPAAKSLHHAFIGGLLEHVVSLFQLCDLACRNYPGMIDRDLLLAGAFLHDIGKIHELAFARSFTYSTRGQLLGHMIIELEMLQSKLAQFPGFPQEYKTLLEHMIISHHGKYEFGSPKMPMFPEALMLHYLDDLDSKMESMRAHFEREPDSEWTSYNASLERPLLNTRKYLENRMAEPANAQKPSANGQKADGQEERQAVEEQ